MWYITIQKLTIKYLIMTGQFLKPYAIELLDTLLYMIRGFISFITYILQKDYVITCIIFSICYHKLSSISKILAMLFKIKFCEISFLSDENIFEE
jgi:hypothetical protein